MTSTYAATVYSFAFHDPKPLHPLVIRNWAASKAMKFFMYTDRPDAWRNIAPSDVENIEYVEIHVDQLFAKAFEFFGVKDKQEFSEKYGWLFHPTHFSMNGYLGCQLRPLMSSIAPQLTTEYWGWADNDVFINAKLLDAHIIGGTSDLLLFPKSGHMWEQFKLYSARVDAASLYREIIDIHMSTRKPTLGPLEAKFVYHIKNRFKDDALEQSDIAIHWAYTDKLGPIPNQYDVWLKSDMSLVGPEGQTPLFFNADTQLKQFDASQAAVVDRQLEKNNAYRFEYRPTV